MAIDELAGILGPSRGLYLRAARGVLALAREADSQLVQGKDMDELDSRLSLAHRLREKTCEVWEVELTELNERMLAEYFSMHENFTEGDLEALSASSAHLRRFELTVDGRTKNPGLDIGD